MKNFVKKGIMLGAVLPAIALAQAGGIAGQSPVTGSEVDINEILRTIVNFLTALLIILAVVFIIWAAFIYLTAGGDAEKVGNANKMLIYAAVAIAIALLAQGIVYIVAQLFTAGEVAPSEGDFF